VVNIIDRFNIPVNTSVAERSGIGLQNQIQGFDSSRACKVLKVKNKNDKLKRNKKQNVTSLIQISGSFMVGSLTSPINSKVANF
jgi:hypothetical protein